MDEWFTSTAAVARGVDRALVIAICLHVLSVFDFVWIGKCGSFFKGWGQMLLKLRIVRVKLIEALAKMGYLF